MNEVTITEQMAEAVNIPVADANAGAESLPAGIQEKVDAIKASAGDGFAQPVQVGFVQTEEETAGTPVLI